MDIAANDAAGLLTERLRRLARYGAGWDGYRAEPASPAAAELACATIAALGFGDGLEASIGRDGAVDVSGEFPRGRVRLAFSAHGTVDASVREAGAWSEAESYRLLDAGRPAVPAGLRAFLAEGRRAA